MKTASCTDCVFITVIYPPPPFEVVAICQMLYPTGRNKTKRDLKRKQNKKAELIVYWTH